MKVVDYGLSPVKTGSTHLCVPVCVNDTVFSKPTSVGRNEVDDQAQTNNNIISCVVCVFVVLYVVRLVSMCLKVVLL